LAASKWSWLKFKCFWLKRVRITSTNIKICVYKYIIYNIYIYVEPILVGPPFSLTFFQGDPLNGFLVLPVGRVFEP